MSDAMMVDFILATPNYEPTTTSADVICVEMEEPISVTDCPRRLSTDSDVSNGSGISEASGGTAVISDVNTGSVFNESNDHIEATFDVSTESGINKGSGSTGVIADMNSGSDFIESNDHIGATSDVSTESGISEGSGGTAVIADMPTETDFNENNDHTGATFDVSTESGISEGSGGTGMTFDMSTGCGISENSGSIGVADDVSTRSGSSEGSDDTGFTSDVSTGSDSIEGNDGTGINPKSSGGRFVLRATPMRHRSRASRKRISTRASGRVTKRTKLSVTRINREDVKTPDFLLDNLPWSEWKLGVMSRRPKGQPREEWQRRHEDHIGVRNTHVFDGETDRPSVYEVAVQPEPGAPKYPVACAVTSGFQQRNWDRVVLKNYAHHQVDRVLQRGCKLLVRRASIRPNKKSGGTVEDSMKELRSLIGRHYDYAWKCRFDADSRTYPNRQLFINDKMISDGTCPVIY